MAWTPELAYESGKSNGEHCQNKYNYATQEDFNKDGVSRSEQAFRGQSELRAQYVAGWKSGWKQTPSQKGVEAGKALALLHPQSEVSAHEIAAMSFTVTVLLSKQEAKDFIEGFTEGFYQEYRSTQPV